MMSPQQGLTWHIGTMGFAYADWLGPFYPSGMPARKYLSYYSRVFNAVEIDSTFYGIPRLSTVERWAANTPSEFRFCLKAPRQITHESTLDTAALGLMDEYLKVLGALGAKLGAILLQFPPSFRSDRLSGLEKFVSSLPVKYRFAVEVRHNSWYTILAGAKEPPLAGILRAHDVCWAATEYPGLPSIICPTTDWLYIRWIGEHGRYPSHSAERVDMRPELSAWGEKISTVQDEMAEVYGFLNNDYAGFAVATADRLKGLLGLPRKPYRPPQQGRLF